MMEVPPCPSTGTKGFPTLTLSDIGSAYKYGYVNQIILNLTDFLIKHPHSDYVLISVLPGEGHQAPVEVILYPDLNVLHNRYSSDSLTFHTDMEDASKLICAMDLLVARTIRRPVMIVLNAKLYDNALDHYPTYNKLISELGSDGKTIEYIENILKIEDIQKTNNNPQ